MKFTPEEIGPIRRMLRDGASRSDIAEALGVPRSSFDQRLSKSGYRVIQDLEEITPVRDDADSRGDILATVCAPELVAA